MRIRAGLREKMDTTGKTQTEKTREIWLAKLPPGQIESAAAILEALRGVAVTRHPSGYCVTVAYSVLDHTLEELENRLLDEGHNLGTSLLIKIKRALAYYSEACQRGNLNIPGRDQHLRNIYSSKHACSACMKQTEDIYYQ